MRSKPPVTIDMTVEGSFTPGPASVASWPMRIGVVAAIIALGAGAVTLAAVFLWVASILMPVAIVAAVVAYAAFRIQGRWRAH